MARFALHLIRRYMNTINMQQLEYDIACRILRLEGRSMTKLAFHNYCQSAMVSLAKKHSCVGKKEFKVSNVTPGKNGALDVVWTRFGIPVLAIEIDSCIRKKSIQKLMKFPNCQRLWLYYGKRNIEQLHKVIDADKITVLPMLSGHFFNVSDVDAIEKSQLVVHQNPNKRARVTNFPSAGTYLTPEDLRAMAKALQLAADDSELQRATGEQRYNLEREHRPVANASPDVVVAVAHFTDARKSSFLVKFVTEFGEKRFGLGELHRVLFPDRFPSFIREDEKLVRRQAAGMVRQGFFEESKGPRGGDGWVLTPTAINKAKYG